MSTDPFATLPYSGEVPTDPPQPLQSWPPLPGYTIQAELGRGGMGVVYKAWNLKLKRFEAIKIIRSVQLASQEEKARFHLEAAAAGSLDHPNIIPVYAPGEHDGMLYLAMRFAEGGSLAERMKRSPYAPREAARLIAKIATAVDYAHRRGVLHRDLKPANVLLEGEGEPMVADFGLARHLDAQETLTATGIIHGTPGYMAPEQARASRNQTVAVDIFGIGAMLYALLTKRPPFKGESIPEVLRQTEECSPTSPSLLNPCVDIDLAAICLKCLERDPGERYASAGELAQDLDRYLSGNPIHARLPGIWGHAVRLVLRQQFGNIGRWGWWTLFMGILGIITHSIGACFIFTNQPRECFLLLSLLYLLTMPPLLYWTLHGQKFEIGDRHTLSMTIGLTLTSMLLPEVYRPIDDANLLDYRLSVYPLIALLHALAYIIWGSLFWGGFYVYGFGFLVLAVIMKSAPYSSPFAFALYSGTVQILIGLYLIRLRIAIEAEPTA